MNVDEARETVQCAFRAMAPETLPNLTLPQLQEHYDALCEARLVLLQHSYTSDSTDGLLHTLRQEIAGKLAEQRGERHHTESVGLDRRILHWTRWAVVAAVVVPILVALIAEIPFSRLLRATASQASPTSSMRSSPTPETTTAPMAVELQSATPQASPTPSETETPIKLPPPAP